MLRVFVVGAGPSGAALSYCLAKRLGDQVAITVVEKEERVGGRAFPLPRTGSDGCADLGAQYLTIPASTPQWRRDLYKEMEAAGVLRKLSSDDIDGPNPYRDDSAVEYVAPRGMGSLCEYLLQEAKASVETGKEVPLGEVVKAPPAGHDVVVITVPGMDKEVQYSERYALSLTFPGSISHRADFTGWSARYLPDGAIRYVSQDEKKRTGDTASPSTTLVVHSSVPYALRNTDMDEAAKHLMAEFEALFPGLGTPIHRHLLRLAPSQVYRGKAGIGCVELEEHVLLTGDAYAPTPNIDGCIENAWQLAVRMARNSSL
eukprot:Sspe_Gene.113796::Locus_98561_Transcript_2_2_Confidence_0.667_Length_1056::g.113796::m.113796/K18208/RNLS; renalase